MAASSRPIKSSEAQSLAALGDFSSPAAEQVIAIDGLAVILHPQNPLNALSSVQLAQVPDSTAVLALERMHVLRLLDPTIGSAGLFKGERIIQVLALENHELRSSSASQRKVVPLRTPG